MQFLQKTVHMVFFFSEYYSTFFLYDIIDSLSKSTEGENQIALIDKGKKENDWHTVFV